MDHRFYDGLTPANRGLVDALPGGRDRFEVTMKLFQRALDHPAPKAPDGGLGALRATVDANRWVTQYAVGSFDGHLALPMQQQWQLSPRTGELPATASHPRMSATWVMPPEGRSWSELPYVDMRLVDQRDGVGSTRTVHSLESGEALDQSAAGTAGATSVAEAPMFEEPVARYAFQPPRWAAELEL